MPTAATGDLSTKRTEIASLQRQNVECREKLTAEQGRQAEVKANLAQVHDQTMTIEQRNHQVGVICFHDSCDSWF